MNLNRFLRLSPDSPETGFFCANTAGTDVKAQFDAFFTVLYDNNIKIHTKPPALAKDPSDSCTSP